jgi:hypothetical protein
VLRCVNNIDTLGDVIEPHCHIVKSGERNAAIKKLKDALKMTQHKIDSNTLRAELRALPRGSLLLIAERAVGLVAEDQLGALLGDIVQTHVDPGGAGPEAPATVVVQSLLDDVRSFYDVAKAGEFYEHVETYGRGGCGQSRGTDAFVAEFDRLMRRCVYASEVDITHRVTDGFGHDVRDSFELLFALLRHIDEGHDDMLFFADEGSSLDVGVNWRVVLPAYFECLAETEAASPEEFARAVDQVITDFAGYDRVRYMDAAHKAATDAQRIAKTSK